MLRHLTVAICAIAAISGGVSGAPARAETAGTATLSVQRDIRTRSVELTTDSAIALESDLPFTELSIANPNIADISTISTTSIYLLGKKPGRTTLMLMGDDGRVMTVIDVRVSPDISEFRDRLAEILPGEPIGAFTANDGIVLTGEVSGPAAVKRALELASHYAPGRISNLMTVVAQEETAPDLGAFGDRLRALLPDEPITVDIVNEGLVLSGTVASQAARDTALKFAESFAPGRVTNLMTLRAASPAAPDADRIARNIAEILPGEDIRVHVLDGAIILSGNASSSEVAGRAMDVAGLVAGGARISNMMTVDAARSCTVRTRRGAETIETSIPCRQETSLDSAPREDPAPVVADQPVETSERLEDTGTPLPRVRPRARPDPLVAAG